MLTVPYGGKALDNDRYNSQIQATKFKFLKFLDECRLTDYRRNEDIKKEGNHFA
jgi:hypothetical protein